MEERGEEIYMNIEMADTWVKRTEQKEGFLLVALPTDEMHEGFMVDKCHCWMLKMEGLDALENRGGWLLLVMTYRDASLKLHSDAMRIAAEDYESVAEHIYGHQENQCRGFDS